MTPSVEILVPKSLSGHTNIRGMLAAQGTKNHVCWTEGASSPSPEARLRKKQDMGAAQTRQVPDLLRKEGLAFILRLQPSRIVFTGTEINFFVWNEKSW